MSPRRQRSRRKRVARILDGAQELVAADGLEALTITGLAQRLDIAAGGLYRYYESKEALVAALSARAVAQLGQDLASAREGWAPALPAAADGALAEIWATVAWYAALPQRRPTLLSLVSRLVGTREQLLEDDETPAVRAAMVALLSQVAEMFAAAAASGALHEPGPDEPQGSPLGRALAFWSALHGTLLVGKFARFWPQQHAVFAEPQLSLGVAQALLVGWGAKPAVLAAAREWVECNGREEDV